jgi:hypothetical protein
VNGAYRASAPQVLATGFAIHIFDQAEHSGRNLIAKALGCVAGPYGLPMPSLFRLLVVLGLLSGFAYGAIFALATLVQPKPREITVTIPQDRLAKPR